MKYKPGDRVRILTYVTGLKTNSRLGTITHTNGGYILVLPDGRKKGQEVELYPIEIKVIR